MSRSTRWARTSVRALAVFTSLLVALLCSPQSLQGQGWIDVAPPGPDMVAGRVERVSSTVTLTVEGRVARVEVEERFRNTAGTLAEGAYLYPLPGEAVFTGLSLWAGETELDGETMTAEQARGIYEEIVRRKRDPALLTFAGH